MAESILGKLLGAAVDAAQGLSLSGIASTSIQQLGGLTATTLDNQLPGRPCIVFAPFGAEEIPDAGGTNTADDVTYRVVCAIIDAANNDHNPATLDARYHWRELLIDHFIHNPLSVSLANAALYDQTLELQPIVDLGAWSRNWHLSAFVIRFTVRRQRRAGE